MKNNEISKAYGVGIYSALKQVPWLKFQPRDTEKNIMQGFYKDGERHDISYLAGNYRAFCLITKSVNRLLKDNGKQIIHFRDKSHDEQVKSVKKLTNILKLYSHKIFKYYKIFYIFEDMNIIGNIFKFNFNIFYTSINKCIFIFPLS